MHVIAIVGIGGIGFRHLESCIELPCEKYSIHAVDINKNNLQKVASAFSKTQITFHDDLQTLPSHIDVCIVATQANIRASIAKELIKRKKIDYLILEKVLFQKVEEYKEVEMLITKHKISTWVNCPRRVWLPYQELRQYIKDKQIVQIEVEGKNWDLGCNAIHYIDLISYLLDSSFYKIVESNFPSAPEESKRKGNYHINGEIKGIFEKEECHFMLSSLSGTVNSKKIRIKTYDNLVINVTESVDNVDIEFSPHYFRRYNIPFQSKLTSFIILDLINTSSCNLASYQVSASLHLPLINVYFAYLKKYFPKLEFCSVT